MPGEKDLRCQSKNEEDLRKASWKYDTKGYLLSGAKLKFGKERERQTKDHKIRNNAEWSVDQDNRSANSLAECCSLVCNTHAFNNGSYTETHHSQLERGHHRGSRRYDMTQRSVDAEDSDVE